MATHVTKLHLFPQSSLQLLSKQTFIMNSGSPGPLDILPALRLPPQGLGRSLHGGANNCLLA